MSSLVLNIPITLQFSKIDFNFDLYVLIFSCPISIKTRTMHKSLQEKKKKGRREEGQVEEKPFKAPCYSLPTHPLLFTHPLLTTGSFFIPCA